MINIDFRPYNPSKKIEKNNLYKLTESGVVQFIEEHESSKEIVDVEYSLQDAQYGFYANEYRRPGTLKEGCKTTDVLAGVIDQNSKKIVSLIFDVKSNISAFSDDLTKSSAMITAVKEVRDFVEQLYAELLHKESFMLYYKAGGYLEEELLGIVTKSFEAEKFKEVAEKLHEDITEEKNISSLISLKAKNNLRAYANQVEVLNNFADRKIIIGQKMYQLQVYILEKINEQDYGILLKISV